MIIIYNRQNPPNFFAKSIYLAGINTKSTYNKSWREEAIDILKDFEYDGVVFFPEDDPDGEFKFPDKNTNPKEYEDQIRWERKWLNAVDCILFWIPREDNKGLITNVEFGTFINSGKIVVGSIKDKEKTDDNNYLKILAKEYNIDWQYSLGNCVRLALDIIDKGSNRVGSEREIPIKIWNDKSFKDWKNSINSNDLACNIQNIDILYQYYTNISKKLFLWIMQPNIEILKENRNKTNEFIIGRPDIVSFVLYSINTKNIYDSKVLLVKEFRSSCKNNTGYVYDLPCGTIDSEDPFKTVLKELKEETSIELKNAYEAKYENTRQIFATLLTTNNI